MFRSLKRIVTNFNIYDKGMKYSSKRSVEDPLCIIKTEKQQVEARSTKLTTLNCNEKTQATEKLTCEKRVRPVTKLDLNNYQIIPVNYFNENLLVMDLFYTIPLVSVNTHCRGGGGGGGYQYSPKAKSKHKIKQECPPNPSCSVKKKRNESYCTMRTCNEKNKTNFKCPNSKKKNDPCKKKVKRKNDDKCKKKKDPCKKKRRDKCKKKEIPAPRPSPLPLGNFCEEESENKAKLPLPSKCPKSECSAVTAIVPLQFMNDKCNEEKMITGGHQTVTNTSQNYNVDEKL